MSRRLFAALAMLPIGAAAQTALLPAPVLITGTVTRTGGTFISDVEIQTERNPVLDPALKADARGRFSFQTKAPAIVFRSSGYESYLYRTKANSNLRIELTPMTRTPPQCSGNPPCDSLGWGSRFCFPKVAGVHAWKPGTDVDYIARSFIIETPGGRKGMRHGTGPSWDWGKPPNSQVWASAEYREITYSEGGAQIVDARGVTATGARWRYLGRSGESISYHDLTAEEAILLDKVLDGVCILNVKR